LHREFNNESDKRRMSNIEYDDLCCDHMS